jgi:hypothetical protein
MFALPDITRADVLAAIASVKREGVPAGRGSTKFCLLVDGEHLPPKYTVALAARRLLGRELRPGDFSGGSQANAVLEALGFVVLTCTCGGSPASPRQGTRRATAQDCDAPVRSRRLAPAPATSPGASGATSTAWTTTILRLVAKGRTPDAAAAEQRMLLDAFKSRWPKGTRVKFVLTPGGFVRASWPRGLVAKTGWESRPRDAEAVIDHAAQVLAGVVTERLFDAATGKTDVLTIGIDVVQGSGGSHAELVAVYDVAKRRLVRWTGKSYPTSNQEQTLVHVVDLDTHLLEMAGERVLVLGCHDLNMFSPRGRANQAPDGLRRQRCDLMRTRVVGFKPTIVLQHPHSTDTPNIWRLPWLSLAKAVPTIRTWASGIAYYSWGEGERADLSRVLDLTKSDGQQVVDVVLDATAYG